VDLNVHVTITTSNEEKGTLTFYITGMFEAVGACFVAGTHS